VNGPSIDEIIVKIDGSGSVYYHQDGLGRTVALSDAVGGVAESYQYDAFGSTEVFSSSLILLPSSSASNRFLFTGREWIVEIEIYDYRNRFYSAELGRFLKTDPIRFGAADVNLYRYVKNRSTIRIDYFGLGDIPYYGEYGGPGWTNGGYEDLQFPNRNPKPGDIGPPHGPLPREDQDACYMEHDRAYARCKHKCPPLTGEAMRQCKRDADDALQACLRKTRNGPNPGSLPHSLGADALFTGTNQPSRPSSKGGGHPAK